MNRYRYFIFRRRNLSMFLKSITDEWNLKHHYKGFLMRELCLNRSLSFCHYLGENDEIYCAIAFTRLQT